MCFFTKKVVLCAVAAIAGMLSGSAAEKETTAALKIEYKSAMKDAGKGLIVGSLFAKGAIKYLPEREGVRSPGVLLMTAEKDSKVSYMGFNVNAPKEKLKELKNKTRPL